MCMKINLNRLNNNIILLTHLYIKNNWSGLSCFLYKYSNLWNILWFSCFVLRCLVWWVKRKRSYIKRFVKNNLFNYISENIIVSYRIAKKNYKYKFFCLLKTKHSVDHRFQSLGLKLTQKSCCKRWNGIDWYRFAYSDRRRNKKYYCLYCGNSTDNINIMEINDFLNTSNWTKNYVKFKHCW